MTLTERMKAAVDAAKAIRDRVNAENRDFTPAERKEVTRLVDEAKQLKQQAIREEVDEFDRKLAGDRAGGAQPEWRQKSDPAVAGSWAHAYKTELTRMGRKALGLGEQLTVPLLDQSITIHPDRPRTLLELLVPFTPLDGNTDLYAFMRETTRTLNAAVVAPGAVKPESVLDIEKVDIHTRTVAHLSPPIPNQTLDDINTVAQYVQNALLAGLQLAVEDETLNGDGTGEHFEGILETTGILTQDFDTDEFVTTRRALQQLQATSHLPGPFQYVMSAATWATIELLTTDLGTFKLDQPGQRMVPVDGAQQRLWGQQVVISEALPEGQALCGQFDGESIELVQRQSPTIEWSQEVPVTIDAVTESAFRRNMKQFRAEMRAGLAVKRPFAFCVVDLSPGS